MILQLVQIVILLSLLIGMKKRNVQQIAKEEMMSREQTNCIKGFMAIVIMLGHFAKDMNGIAMFALNKVGVLGVGIFFFLSGYGLMQSNQNSDDSLRLGGGVY